MWLAGSGVCSGSPTSPSVVPVDGVCDEREGGWRRKMAREREMVFGKSTVSLGGAGGYWVFEGVKLSSGR